MGGSETDSDYEEAQTTDSDEGIHNTYPPNRQPLSKPDTTLIHQLHTSHLFGQRPNKMEEGLDTFADDTAHELFNRMVTEHASPFMKVYFETVSSPRDLLLEYEYDVHNVHLFYKLLLDEVRLAIRTEEDYEVYTQPVRDRTLQEAESAIGIVNHMFDELSTKHRIHPGDTKEIIEACEENETLLDWN